MAASTILMVDDDAYLVDLVRFALERAGYRAYVAHTGRDAVRLAQAQRVDLILLDINLPDSTGFAVLSALRRSSEVPVILLTARAREEDVLAGLGYGADDYIVKPFSMAVLLRRVAAVLRRAAPQAEPGAPARRRPAPGHHYHLGGVVFDAEARTLLSQGVQVRLTPLEGRLLALLCAHAGQVLSAAHLLERVGGPGRASSATTIKTHIRHLRAKFSLLPGQPQPIRTLPGAGYMVPTVDGQGGAEADER